MRPTETMKVICFLFDPNVGGPTIRARSVYERMIAQGYDVRIAIPSGEGTAEGYFREKAVPVDRLAIAKPVLPRKVALFLKFAFTAPIGLLRLVLYLRKNRPDVIHVNGAFDILPALAGRIARVPVVWHLNDTVFGPGLSLRLGRFVDRMATVVIAAAGRVASHYGVAGDKVIIVHAPVDVDQFPARNPKGYPKVPAKLVLVGNWNWIKGQDHFVSVVEGVAKAGLDVQASIAGKFLDGQKDYWQPILDRIQSDGLSQIIECPGFVFDTPGFLGGADLLLLTSHSEASPISVHEAMSIGVPVVSYDVGGVHEMLGDGEGAAGIVIPKGDDGAMQTAVIDLLSDPAKYHHMAINGQVRARKLYSLSACVDKHVLAYDKACKGRKEATS